MIDVPKAKWITCRVQCDVCDKHWIAVAPVLCGCLMTDFECPRCGLMSGQAILHDDDDDDIYGGVL